MNNKTKEEGRRVGGQGRARGRGGRGLRGALENLREISGLRRFVCLQLLVSSNWGPLTLYFKQYPWNPLSGPRGARPGRGRAPLRARRGQRRGRLRPGRGRRRELHGFLIAN